ncbi:MULTISPECIES: hypothetical protein [Microbulbifer]|uniref:hypothetical protein n=1 Tax=Microbulbifer TaxID=48073 RepID=UPI001E554611|nr:MULTISPECIES: hypothetical protein [Microbulbifer]UHQ54344.1 hypothetical protein LVE68_12550 [Microbulbifer sp. YPW16]
MNALKKEIQRVYAGMPRHLRQQLIAAGIWLVLACFCAVALSNYYAGQRDAAIARDRVTAEVAAAFVASQSLESIVAGDRISLQLLARNMLEMPVISGIAIQDVESSALAQGGDLDSGETVSAPVVLHDSIAGNVIVHLQPGEGVRYPWASLLLSLVFALPVSAAAALAVGSLAARRTPVVAARPAPQPEPEVLVGLYLRPLNWSQLGNQLSRSALERLQDELRERLALLGRIYDARPLKHAGPQQGLGFCGDDAAFRAVCCGLLLRELQAGGRSSGLQLATAVVPAALEPADFGGEPLLGQARDLALHDDLLEAPSLKGRIAVHSASWGAAVTGLDDTYQKLLDSQLRQLQGA